METQNGFEKWMNVIKRLGEFDSSQVFDLRGKITDFAGVLKAYQNREINLGVVYYPWKRSLGVNKINQVVRKSKNAGLDGAIIISNQFSQAAEDQVNRINEVSDIKMVLLNTHELDILSEQDENKS